MQLYLRWPWSLCGWAPDAAASLITECMLPQLPSSRSACCRSFPHHGVHAAAAAEQAARLAAGLAPLPYRATVDELLSVGIQRLQANKTCKVWTWPLAAKEFLDKRKFK